MTSVLYSIVFGLTVWALTAATQPEVTLTLGKIRGTTKETISGRKFYSFESVPYANPPIGKNRFMQSVPVDPWLGVLNATHSDIMCLQTLQLDLVPTKIKLGTEDCLYLNIYTPKLPSELPDGKLLDVIFYIHGGAFTSGAGAIYGPTYLLDRDVVYVNINYRLDVLGFLSLEDDIVPGNNGLKDQNLALKWVNQHISAFGGDPNKITIVGMSAGAGSVHFHVLSPQSKGLFQKAIASSGVAMNPWAFAKAPRENGLALAKIVGCPTNDSKLAVECMRSRHAEDLIFAVGQLKKWRSLPLTIFAPVIEQPGPNAFIDRPPHDLVVSQSGSDVPLLLTVADDEGYLFTIGMISNEKASKEIDESWDKLAPIIFDLREVEPEKAIKVAHAIREHYMGNKTMKENPAGFTKAFSDRYFVAGIQKAAKLHAKYQTKPVYGYRFAFPAPPGYLWAQSKDKYPYKGGKAFHGEDNAYVFNSFYLAPIKLFPDALAMSKTMIDYWMKFITEGTVSSWQPVVGDEQEVTMMDVISSDPGKNVFTKQPSATTFWDQQEPEVTLTLGKLKGTTKETISGRKFYSFESVPYANPPIGKNRFMQSVPVDPWLGVLDATHSDKICLQTVQIDLVPTRSKLGTEDCLYLNIYTPKLPSELPDGKLLDVIFYIHGGAFTSGAGAIYGPTYLLDRDVVYVNINYRLDVFGFLSLEDDIVPGNNGLKDQNLALKWVNQHISAFGGDPNKITIVGMSAGAGSVHFHVLSPQSKGLFQKAIASSGVAMNPWAFAKAPRENGLALAKIVGCPTNDSKLAVECMRSRHAEDLIFAVGQLKKWRSLPLTIFAPVIEQPGPNAFIDRPPHDLVVSQSGSDVPLLLSVADDEGYVFTIGLIANETAAQEIDESWDKLAPVIFDLREVEPEKAIKVAHAIREHYMGNKTMKENPAGFTKAFSDRYFVAGIQKAAKLHAKHQTKPVYGYRFAFPAPPGYNLMVQSKDKYSYKGGKAFHGEDNAYVFNSFYLLPIKWFPEALAMSKTLIDYWMKFITEGTVSSWQPVVGDEQEVTMMDVVSSDPEKNVFTKQPSATTFWDQQGLPDYFFQRKV
ncbi:esterase [Nesidiocoris tenuis]|uniref:Esterase n=2 Tax=Nesidiocoris tenuis TaxID=355587 RepID=A0ABN7ABC4_9HEMI|nr:esterase [Nesidiocoris tenuis]